MMLFFMLKLAVNALTEDQLQHNLEIDRDIHHGRKRNGCHTNLYRHRQFLCRWI